jgi:hypothetical protein
MGYSRVRIKIPEAYLSRTGGGLTLAERPATPKKKNKYNNKKTSGGFDSVKEERRYHVLKLLERAGEISGLELQKRYELIPAQEGERACHYIADFCYTDRHGTYYVEDVKGFKTPDYVIKRKLMLHVHKIKVIEI